MTILDFWQKKSTVILSMLGVKFKKIIKKTFIVYKKDVFFRKVDKKLYSSFKALYFKMAASPLALTCHWCIPRGSSPPCCRSRRPSGSGSAASPPRTPSRSKIKKRAFLDNKKCIFWQRKFSDEKKWS